MQYSPTQEQAQTLRQLLDKDAMPTSAASAKNIATKGVKLRYTAFDRLIW